MKMYETELKGNLNLQDPWKQGQGHGDGNSLKMTQLCLCHFINDSHSQEDQTGMLGSLTHLLAGTLNLLISFSF